MTAALARVGEVISLGLAGVAIDDVPQRRLVELARWGMAAKAPALRRHPHKRPGHAARHGDLPGGQGRRRRA